MLVAFLTDLHLGASSLTVLPVGYPPRSPSEFDQRLFQVQQRLPFTVTLCKDPKYYGH
jgi:hypothetical protein